jgi:trimethylamine-N-oxide reductase (cytochrome c)
MTVWGAALKARLYAPDRLLYPLKRVGFQPGGQSDVSNRGKGEFVRISWEEALSTTASEIMRIQGKYGPSGVIAWNNAHMDGGSLQHEPLSQRFRMLMGASIWMGDGDSWTDWMYAGPFVWGYVGSHGEGDTTDMLQDIMKNSKLVINWGTDPTITEGSTGGHDGTNQRFWLKQLGIKVIAINPYFSDTDNAIADQWLPVIPGDGDVALALAIANVWINEGTYDKDYVSTHTVGFQQFSDYVLGNAAGPDGAKARTPQWAAPLSGIDAQTITSVAREWASKPTSLWCYHSGACRGAYMHEWGRLMILLQAMQGLGKPGVSIGTPTPPSDGNIRTSQGLKGIGRFTSAGINKFLVFGDFESNSPIRQALARIIYQECILTDFSKNPPLTWTAGEESPWWGDPPGTGNIPANGDPSMYGLTEKWQYPAAGYSEVHMVMRHGGVGAHGLQDVDTNRHSMAYRSPKLEFAVGQNTRMDAEVMHWDIVLPVATPLERIDISDNNNSGGMVGYWQPVVKPLGESQSDYWIYSQLADRLAPNQFTQQCTTGPNFRAAFTEGNSEEDWVRKFWMKSSIAQMAGLTWEQFKAKGYFPWPYDDTKYTTNTAYAWYYQRNGPNVNGMATPSGKIEFASSDFATHFGKDSLWVTPKYYTSPHGRFGPRAAQYPLQVCSAHTKWRYHSKYNNVPFVNEQYKLKPNLTPASQGLPLSGSVPTYGYEPVFVNPADAASRGLKEKDVVKIFNEVGTTLAYVHITERIRPGVILLSEGSWYQQATPGDATSVDLGGNINTLCGHDPNSPIAFLNHYTSEMVEVQKWTGS